MDEITADLITVKLANAEIHEECAKLRAQARRDALLQALGAFNGEPTGQQVHELGQLAVLLRDHPGLRNDAARDIMNTFTALLSNPGAAQPRTSRGRAISEAMMVLSRALDGQGASQAPIDLS